jgi:hypothetical protein
MREVVVMQVQEGVVTFPGADVGGTTEGQIVVVIVVVMTVGFPG